MLFQQKTHQKIRCFQELICAAETHGFSSKFSKNPDLEVQVSPLNHTWKRPGRVACVICIGGVLVDDSIFPQIRVICWIEFWKNVIV